MRKAKIFVKGLEAGTLTEVNRDNEYVFEYLDNYEGLEISRTMPSDVRFHLGDPSVDS